MAKRLSGFGFIHIETGDIIRRKHQDLAPSIDFHEWADKNNKKDRNFLNECILEVIINAQREISILNKSNIQDIIITGNRQIDGINYIMEQNRKDMGRGKTIIYMDAPIEELYQRQIKREDRIIPNLTFEKFKSEYLAFDKEMGLENIKKHADCVINSSNENNEIFRKISMILKERGYNFKKSAERSENEDYLESYKKYFK